MKKGKAVIIKGLVEELQRQEKIINRIKNLLLYGDSYSFAVITGYDPNQNRIEIPREISKKVLTIIKNHHEGIRDLFDVKIESH